MRAMLDELMGKERNVPLGQRSNRRIRFDDPDVCKYALAGLCPNGLFKNTRSDLGVAEFILECCRHNGSGQEESPTTNTPYRTMSI